jgi:hypothetical protein
MTNTAAKVRRNGKRPRRKQSHPADAAHDKLAFKAECYAVHLRISPSRKITGLFKQLTEAVRFANELQLEYKIRTPIIYAIMPAGIEPRQVLVTPAILAEMLNGNTSAAAEAAPAPKTGKVESPAKAEKNQSQRQMRRPGRPTAHRASVPSRVR